MIPLVLLLVHTLMLTRQFARSGVCVSLRLGRGGHDPEHQLESSRQALEAVVEVGLPLVQGRQGMLDFVELLLNGVLHLADAVQGIVVVGRGHEEGAYRVDVSCLTAERRKRLRLVAGTLYWGLASSGPGVAAGWTSEARAFSGKGVGVLAPTATAGGRPEPTKKAASPKFKKPLFLQEGLRRAA